MRALLLFVFVLLPLAEITLFVVIGQTIGLWPTLLGVLTMGLAGALLIRRQGVALLTDIGATMGRGELPTRQIADAMLVGVAGLLLVVPGYFSDLLALLLLIPAVRTLLYRWLRARLVVMPQDVPPYGSTMETSRIEGEGVVDLGADDWRQG